MRTRVLTISTDLLARILSEPRPWQIFNGRLPEDAKIVGIDVGMATGFVGGILETIKLKIESSVFQDSEPDDLPGLHFIAHHIKP